MQRKKNANMHRPKIQNTPKIWLFSYEKIAIGFAARLNFYEQTLKSSDDAQKMAGK